MTSLVGWGSRILDWISAEELSLQNECPGYDTKQSDSEVLVTLELWGIRGALSLSSLPDQLWLQVIASEKVFSMGQIELFDI